MLQIFFPFSFIFNIYAQLYDNLLALWFGTVVPDGLHAVAEVIENVAVLDAAAGREEATDNAGDVAADVERLWIIHADALHAEAEAADARQDDSLAVTQFFLQQVLKLRDDTNDGAF